MKKIVKKSGIIVLLFFLVCPLSGCMKKEEQFNFNNVAAVRIYHNDDAHYVEELDDQKAQELMMQLAEIVWVENQDETVSLHNDDWIYRIQSYSKKGEKKHNIYINSRTRITNKQVYWDAEDGKELDLSIYDALFH